MVKFFYSVVLCDALVSRGIETEVSKMEKGSVMLEESYTTGLSTLGTEVVSVVANDINPIHPNWAIFNAPIHPAFQAQQFNIDARRDDWYADRSTYDRSMRQEVLLN